MADPSSYEYDSPLKDWEGMHPLPSHFNDDGKSYYNPPTDTKSPAYTSFTPPIVNGTRPGFDIHIYYHQDSEYETKFATELWERIRREFPELAVYKLWGKPLGLHPIAMFEVNVFSPAQFGAFVSWLVINRGPLSALIHPNTGDAYRDHSQRATWMGDRIPLHFRIFKELQNQRQADAGSQKT